MRVVVPAVPGKLLYPVVPAILDSGFDLEVRVMGAGEDYFHLMRELWAAGRTFAIVEHDVVVAPDSLGSFEDCPEPWCAFSYEVYAGDVATAYGHVGTLGCTRFRAELLERFPRAVIEAGRLDQHPKHPPRSYAVMDSTLSQVLLARGPRPHQHFPNVHHLHGYDRENAYHPPAAVASPS